jgi:hypothetical protein
LTIDGRIAQGIAGLHQGGHDGQLVQTLGLTSMVNSADAIAGKGIGGRNFERIDGIGLFLATGNEKC